MIFNKSHSISDLNLAFFKTTQERYWEILRFSVSWDHLTRAEFQAGFNENLLEHAMQVVLERTEP